MDLSEEMQRVFVALDIETDGATTQSRLRDDLDMDSAEIIDMVAQCESVYGVTIPDDGSLASSLNSVSDVLALVESHRTDADTNADATPGDVPADIAMDTAAGFAHRCTQTQTIEAPLDKVYAALHDVAEWPTHLPHVQAIDVQYDDGQYQEFFMTVASEGDTVLKVRSIRNCRDELIEFFQPVPPPYLANHGGVWRFSNQGNGTTRVDVTHVWNLNEKASAAFPEKPDATTEDQVRDLLSEHSRLALAGWKRVLEGVSV